MKLYNGIDIPQIGFGPGGWRSFFQSTGRAQKSKMWTTFPGRIVNRFVFRRLNTAAYRKMIASGIRAGFRLIDYSCAYGAVEDIALGIEMSGVSRDDIFLTGRISNRAQFGGAESVRLQIDKMLEGYRTDAVDLLMFHWPVTGHFEETWREICRAYDAGKAKSIGVANCHPHHIEKLMRCGLKPMVNQFEVHPLFTQKDLIKYNQDLEIVVEAYTAIARFDDRLMRLPALKKIAMAHGKSTAQVVLRWHIQNGCIPVIRSTNPVRQKENFAVFDFELSSDEIKVIDGFNINSRLRYDPDNCDFTIL